MFSWHRITHLFWQFRDKMTQQLSLTWQHLRRGGDKHWHCSSFSSQYRGWRPHKRSVSFISVYLLSSFTPVPGLFYNVKYAHIKRDDSGYLNLCAAWVFFFSVIKCKAAPPQFVYVVNGFCLSLINSFRHTHTAVVAELSCKALVCPLGATWS